MIATVVRDSWSALVASFKKNKMLNRSAVRSVCHLPGPDRVLSVTVDRVKSHGQFQYIIRRGNDKAHHNAHTLNRQECAWTPITQKLAVVMGILLKLILSRCRPSLSSVMRCLRSLAAWREKNKKK